MKKVLSMSVVVLSVLFVVSSVAMAAGMTPQLVKEKAVAAAKLVEAQGPAAFDALKDPNGEFRFGEGAGYVWVQDLDANMIMHPIKPEMDGRSFMDMKDVNGVYMFVAFSEVAEDNGEGWVPYSWPKPGSDVPASKVSYVVHVQNGGVDYVIGSGMYDVTADDVKAQFPGDAIYEDEL